METDRQLSVKMLITLLQSEYPNSFVNMDERLLKLKIELWEKEFANDDLNVVYAAIRTYMRSPERFAPTIGQIREKMDMLTEPDKLSEVAAWALVSKACRNGYYGYKEEFAKLPPEIQQAVGRPEQLREWAAMDAETVGSVVASNFMRSYRTTKQRAKEMAMIPGEVRQMLSSITQKLELKAAQPRELPGPPEEDESTRRRTAEIQVLADLMPPPEPYIQPTDEEWIRMRDAALQRLDEA
jgi:hypothetical protein